MDSNSDFKVTIEATPTKDTAPTVVRVSQEEAAKYRVGDSIELHLTGIVKGMRNIARSDQPGMKVEIELEGPEISSVAMNPADFELKRSID